MIELKGYVRTEDLDKDKFTFYKDVHLDKVATHTEVNLSYEEHNLEVKLTVEELRKLIGKFYPHPNSPKVQKALNKLVSERGTL